MFSITVKGDDFVNFACKTAKRNEIEQNLINYLKSLKISAEDAGIILEDYVDKISIEIATQALACGFSLGQAAQCCEAEAEFELDE